MRTRLPLALLLSALTACAAAPAPKPAPAPAPPAQAAAPGPFEKDIVAFERADRAKAPPKGVLMFTGSSTIGRWKTLADDFAGLPVVNRGFGGSQIADATRYAPRYIFTCQPRAIYLRAGGNDLNAGKTVEQVFADFKAFEAAVHARLPETDIVFISLSPSIARWGQASKEKALNQLIAGYAKGRPHMGYIETYDLVLGADGKPRPELFVSDRLHFNAEGYKLLLARVRPQVAGK